MAALDRPSWDPFVAIWHVEELLRKTTQALSAATLPYAVVGAYGVAARIESVDKDAARSTPNVDIIIDRLSLPQCIEVLRSTGLEVESKSHVVILGETNRDARRRCVRVLFAGERFRPDDMHALPTLTRVASDVAAYPVVALADQVAMKLQANRLIDKVHIIDMKGVGLITPELVARLPQDLHDRLRQIPEPDTH